MENTSSAQAMPAPAVAINPATQSNSAITTPPADGREAKRARSCVPRACIRCKAAKKCCDSARPCGRCVRLGISEHCFDAQQQKPGRKPKVNLDEPSFKYQIGEVLTQMASQSVVPAPFDRSLLNTPTSLPTVDLIDGLSDFYSLVGSNDAEVARKMFYDTSLGHGMLCIGAHC